LIHEIEKVRGPYKENAPAERAAAAALREDVAWMRALASKAIENRERFAAALRANAFQPYPSAANFLLVPISDAVAVARTMRTGGVAVRPYPGLPGVGDALRITIGPWPMMELALDALLAACGTTPRSDDEQSQ
jgi:histidinol-phosphate/aromatic aminotransferase/cobyric acid decarboxylase-like protein